LKEYLILLTQLENEYLTHPTFSLSTLFYHINPYTQTLALLSSFTSSHLTGGAFINSLQELIKRNSGDAATTSVLATLLVDSMKPYLATVYRWMTRGECYDSHFIIRSGAEWDDVVIEHDHVIGGLIDFVEDISEIGMLVKVSPTSRLVARECPLTVERFVLLKGYLWWSMIDAVKVMKRDANERVLKVLLNKEKLCERVQALQDCMMIGKGDWMTSFLDTAKYV
jgi:Gamma tubulin complex component N-terminal